MLNVMNHSANIPQENTIIKVTNSPNDMIHLVEKKVSFFEDLIQKTLLHVKNNKLLDILGVSEVNNCINTLYELSKKIKDINSTLVQVSHESLINSLQLINNELSSLFKLFGTASLEDLLWICFGNGYAATACTNDSDKAKFELLKKYFHPTSYKVINSNFKQLKEEKKGKSAFIPTKEDIQLYEQSKNLDCYDFSSFTDKFYLKVHGIKVVIINATQNKALIITGIIDDIMIDFLNNAFISEQLKQIREHLPDDDKFAGENFDRFVSSLLLKDLIISKTTYFYEKFAGIQSNISSISQKSVANVVKEFISNDLFNKRNTIIHLLINSSNYESQYLAYLLYDLLSNDSNGIIDTQEQTVIFDSFSWNIKIYFRDAMKKTIKYTNELSNFEISKIPLEQQICLLKVNDAVKEKAMQKLKEVKAKSEDTGSKARQYLDGLLKIPFNIFRKEPILSVMHNINEQFKQVYATSADHSLGVKDKYTSIEIIKHVKTIRASVEGSSSTFGALIDYEKIKAKLGKKNKQELVSVVETINGFIKAYGVNYAEIVIACEIADSTGAAKKDKNPVFAEICKFIDTCIQTHKPQMDLFILEYLFDKKTSLKTIAKKSQNSDYDLLKKNCVLLKELNTIEAGFAKIRNYIGSVKTTMDNAIHGHEKAKKQIERIICQWINGEQDGHCFGFEGPPGVGKTSLAKYGLSCCLKDDKGESRPFSMIQIGGDSNGSSLHGHNYTYVGSNWGAIVQILIDKKCMNPIIFIDEIDKISKTEQGREMVGILTHLLDTTQNDCFQDKYFSGIDLDLSKVLFILSYNDVDSIDKVLLDRIHRIKFSNLSTDDKFVICNKHILPEIYKKMGLEGMVQIDNDILRFIIEEYTCEPGVRKLKEILFEIVGEINKDVLTNATEYSVPIVLTKEVIKMNYLKERNEVIHKTIHKENMVGTINGMYATANGIGGIIPIQTCFMPGSKFLDLLLTGMQGTVMKESMNVALTLAWSLTPYEVQVIVKEKYGEKNVSSIHIHCPEGATPKDGPSAGGAITCAIYSLLNGRKIKRDVAMTGEISLNGNITAIGGLDLKIYGSIKAGIKTIIYPEENEKDYLKFIEKYEGSSVTEGINFHKVTHITQVFDLAFE